MKYVKSLFVCILLLVLATGCQNKQEAEEMDKVESPTSGNSNNKVHRTDELYEKQASGASFVAVKREKWDYVQENEEDDGTYYTYYEVGKSIQDAWSSQNDIELPVEMQPGEFAYVVADTTFITGGIDGRMSVDFKEVKECRKISLEEAVDLLDLPDLYTCEIDYFEGWGSLGIHSKADGFLMAGYMINRYDYMEKMENSYEGEVIAYLQAEEIGRFNRLDFVGDYLVLYHHEGDEDDLTLPEYVTVEAIEELLATGKQYNDVMFVLHKREENSDVSYRKFLIGDRTMLTESQAEIPDFHKKFPCADYTYFDLDGDGGEELLLLSDSYPNNYFGVFHYEEGKITCWYSEADKNAFYYLLRDGTILRKYDNFSDAESYTTFRFGTDGSLEDVSEPSDGLQLIRDKMLNPREWIDW